MNFIDKIYYKYQRTKQKVEKLVFILLMNLPLFINLIVTQSISFIFCILYLYWLFL